MLVVWLEDEDAEGFSPSLGMSDSNGEHAHGVMGNGHVV